MGRKNRRFDAYTPIDLTPDDVPRPKPKPHLSHEEAERARFDQTQQRVERQRNARVNQGVDWSVCVVPGCGKELITWGGLIHRRADRRDAQLEIPICYDHAALVWNQLVGYHAKKGQCAEAIADVNDLIKARNQGEHEQEKAAHMAVLDGHMYFIQLNELVKVGWTRDLFSRVKSYGASAVLLASHPATRDDETLLHRQLTPARARGREWYHDGDIIQRYIAETVEKYGPPPRFEFMWTEPKQVVAGKRLPRGA